MLFCPQIVCVAQVEKIQKKFIYNPSPLFLYEIKIGSSTIEVSIYKIFEETDEF